MFTVLSRPYDEDSIVDVYIADHDSKTKENFEVEWMQVNESVLKDNPEYDVSDIIKGMKRRGWRIMSVMPAKVTY